MRCPACGSENDDGRQWCDFCKEPFNKKKAAPPPVPAAVQPPPARKSPAPAALEGPAIPPEFAGLDSGEKMPTFSPQARLAAWIVFGIALMGLAVLSMLAVRRAAAPSSVRPEAHDE